MRAMSGALDRARAAFDDGDWPQAYALLAAAQPVAAADLERLAVAAYLTGLDRESFHAWERAYRACDADDDLDGAVRCSFWLSLLLRDEVAQAGGWLAVGRAVANRPPASPGP
jgi:hypothetical protein